MGGGLAESDLDLGRKMTKLKFLGWVGGGVGGIRFGLGKKNGKFEIVLGGVGGIRFGLGKKYDKVEIFGVGGVGHGGVGLAESDLDLGRKMTKLKFLGWVGGGLAESDLDLGRKMTKLKFFRVDGWVGGWQNQIWTWEEK